MAVDFGLLGALRGTDNWAGKESNRRAELAYQTAINTIREQKVADNAEAQKTIAAYYNTINNLRVLPKGLERIREISDSLKPQIAESIKKAGGDINKWMKTTGAIELDKYLSTIMNHPITQRELYNATNVAQYQADQQAGLQERLNFLEDGTPVGAITDQLAKYNNGETDTINYLGGFKPGKFDEDFFGRTYGSANRYERKPVSLVDFARTAERQLIEDGMSARDARQQAMGMSFQYKKQLESKGTPLYWKSDRYTPADMLAQFKLKKLQSSGGLDGGISYLAGIHNNLIQPDKATPDGGIRYYLPAMDDIVSIVKATGQDVDDKTGGIKNINNITARAPIYSTDLSTTLDFSGLTDEDIKMTPVGVVSANGKEYIQYRVNASDAALKETTAGGKPVKTKWYQLFSSDQAIPGQKETGDKTSFDVLQQIPINISTIAQQALNAKEASKTGQFALGLGLQQQQVQQNINLLQDMDFDLQE